MRSKTSRPATRRSNPTAQVAPPAPTIPPRKGKAKRRTRTAAEKAEARAARITAEIAALPVGMLSADAVCALLAGASRRRLRQLVQEGELAAYALGGKTIFSGEAALALVAKLKANPGASPYKRAAAVVEGSPSTER
jgi:hypothetical protein